MLHHLISSYGYWAVFILTFFEGEMILVLAGIAAHRGYLNLHLVMAAAFIGTFLGDQLYFHIGYRIGPSLFERRPSWRPGVQRLYHLLSRYETLLVLSFRFLYGLRTIASFAFGAAHVSKHRFLVLNAAGALLWAIVIAYGGYLFGSLFQHFFEGFQSYSLVITAVVAVVIIIILVWRAVRTRSGRRG